MQTLNSKQKSFSHWSQNIYWLILWTSIFLIVLSSTIRLTIIGQGIDDVLRFLFGWTKYLIYLIIWIVIFNKIIKLKFLNYFWIQKKRYYWKLLWFNFNLYWILGLIMVIIEQKSINYADYGFNVLTSSFTQNWLKSSIYSYKIKNITDFFMYHNVFFQIQDGGGIIGLIIASLSCYLSIFGGGLLNLISYFLLISYVIHNSPWFYFLSYEKRDRIRWTNLNEQKKYQIKTNIIDEIEDQDITIELQTARKIQIQDEESSNFNLNQINLEHGNIITNQKKNQVQKVEININQKEEKKEIETNNEWMKPKKDSSFLNWMENNNEQDSTNKIEQNTTLSKLQKTNNALPNLELFNDFTKQNQEKEALNWSTAKQNTNKINQLFKQYQVKAEIINLNVGPRVTRYEINLEQGTKVQKILELEPELKLTLGEQRVRLEAPIPGKSAVGIELPNSYLTLVSWKTIARVLIPKNNQLILGIGKNLMNNVELLNLEKLPHLLVAGSTGGGKTLSLLAMICSLIYQKLPTELKLLLIDPKRVELSIFKDIPHLLSPVITETKLTSIALEKIINEIEKRYKLLEKEEITNIFDFNEKITKEKRIPFIVVIIDELADLILTYHKEIEAKIVRIGQIGRAAGVFMIVATQRPSTDIITGLIKINIPGRIAFSVTNHNDSKTILNFSGAEKLLGSGDMLCVQPGQQPKRVQGVWIERADIKKLTHFWKEQNYPNHFWKEFSNLENDYQNQNKTKNNYGLNEIDQNLYQEIKLYLTTLEHISVSLLQRRFNLGFNRAARIFEKLEAENLIAPADGNKTRKVIMFKKKIPENNYN